MLARHPLALANPVSACAALLALAAVSVAPVPAHGFGLEMHYLMEAGTGAMEKKDPAREAKPQERQRPAPGSPEARIDKEIDKAVDKTVDAVERGAWEVGKKVWKRLEKTKVLGPVLKKLARRWGGAAAMGRAVSPHVETALTVWDFGYEVGSELHELQDAVHSSVAPGDPGTLGGAAAGDRAPGNPWAGRDPWAPDAAEVGLPATVGPGAIPGRRMRRRPDRRRTRPRGRRRWRQGRPGPAFPTTRGR